MKTIVAALVTAMCLSGLGQAEDLGNLSANPFSFDSTANAFGKGSTFAPNGVNNPFSPYGSPFSNTSATNPFATDAPRLYDQDGNYRGKLSANPFDPDSTSNPFGRYGSPFSPDSMNNAQRIRSICICSASPQREANPQSARPHTVEILSPAHHASGRFSAVSSREKH